VPSMSNLVSSSGLNKYMHVVVCDSSMATTYDAEDALQLAEEMTDFSTEERAMLYSKLQEGFDVRVVTPMRNIYIFTGAYV